MRMAERLAPAAGLSPQAHKGGTFSLFASSHLMALSLRLWPFPRKALETLRGHSRAAFFGPSRLGKKAFGLQDRLIAGVLRRTKESESRSN